ncbi:MAG: DAHL domain-containing protein [Phormidesmis sp.]
MSWANFRQTGWQAMLSRTRQLPAWVSSYGLPTLIALLFLLLWTQSQPVNPEQHSQYVSRLRQLQELDARINQDLLQMKVGLLDNYDPIVDKQARVEALQQQLATPPGAVDPARGTLRAQMQESRQFWQQKNDHIQDFITNYAVLRNSLAYFPIAIADISSDPSISPALVTELGTLLRDLLLFNLSTTADRRQRLERDIQQLSGQISPSVESDLSSILVHANLILEKRPVTDRIVERILAVPTREQGARLVETYDVAHQRAVQAANIYRIGLYALLTALAIALAASIVTRLRAAAIAQQQSENTQQALFQAIPDFMLRMYRNSPLYDVVSTGKSVILPNLQAAHGSLYNVLPLEIVQRRLAAIAHVLESRHTEIYEQQLEREGQTVWEEVRVVPCGRDDVLVMIRDICDRKQAEANLQHATKAAQVANRAKSQFLSNITHELRTPLNVILGFTQLMTQNGQLNPQQQNYLDSINQSGEHLLNLINDVLEMSKIEAGKVTLNQNDFDLHGLLNGIHTMFQFKASSKGVQLHLEKGDNLPHYIHTDESKLRQVLINLVGNAVKFTHAGSIHLRAAAEPVEDTLLTNESAALKLCFEVEDTGMGIEPEDVEQLFEPFTQATGNPSAQHEGTGLGLPISRKFVEMMGGEMVISSQIGVGSRFCFFIRVAVARTVPAMLTRRPVVGLAPGQSTYRVLVVEDMPKNRQLLTDLLTPIGFEVAEACNGLEAIEICQQWHPHFVWMDLRMPVMDGYEATRQIKAGENSPSVVALTGSVFKQEEQTALNAGCDAFVCKPFRTEVIFEKMAEFLGVQYLYALTETSAAINQSDSPDVGPLTKRDLQAMPPEWIAQLHQAATRVNSKEIYRLLEVVPPEQVKIANFIGRLVENFCFEEIFNLTES